MEGMDRIASGWLYNTAKKNYWRVEGYCEFEDLIQDGMVCYYKVVRRYPNVVEPKHRMRLFQIAFTNYIHTLSVKRSKQRERIVIEHELGDLFDHMRDRIAGCEELGILLARAPIIVKKLVAAIDSKPEEFRKPYKKRRSGTREKTADRMRRLSGLQYVECTDPMQELHLFLTKALATR